MKVGAGSLSRRSFLSLSAALTASAAVAPLFRPPGPATASTLDPGVTATTSFCEICFWKCGIDVWTDSQGKVKAITGNQDHPLSNGRLCPRGTGGHGNLYDADRIKRPMLRRGDNWVAVEWEEALDFIAEKMQAIAKEYSPSALATISHGHGASFLKHLMKAFGAPVTSAPSYAQCRGPRDTGFKLTFGSGAGSPEVTDMENSTFLVFLGTHLGENMHNTQVQEFTTAIEKGVELVVVDPRFSVAAGKARHWLPIKPGTDLALLLAWIRLLIEDKGYNKDFVERHCEGFDALKAEVSPYTPEWAYTQTGMAPGKIREIAHKLAMHQSSALIHPGRRTNWYGDDTQRARAVAILNALLGNWGKPGGFFSGRKLSIPSYPGPEYPPLDKSFQKLVQKKFPLAENIPTQELRDHTLAGGAPPIKGWLVYGTDLLNNIPYKDKTIAALKKLDLLVVVETMPIELTGWADVVLPDTTYLERFDDLHAPTWKRPYVALRQPVVKPLFDSRPSWWIAKQLAAKLELDAYYPWNTIEDYLDTRLRGIGLTLKQMKQQGVYVAAAAAPYTDHPTFKTPSGKVELYSHKLKSLGFDPVPKFTPPAEPPPGFFRMLIGRLPVHSFGRTGNNPILTELMDENVLWVNAIAAKEFGLRHSQYVRLVNQDGIKSNPIKIKATERIRPDAVFMAHGFGRNTEKLRIAHGKGIADNDLITRVITDPIMGATSTNTNFVTFLPLEGI